MPVLARFFGIIIRMYFQMSEHNPPHIHAIYGEDVAAICIKDFTVLEGGLSPKAMSLVVEWMKIHQEELLKMWETQEFHEIEPLK